MGGQELTLRIVDNTEQFQAMREGWVELQDDVARPNFFVTWEWCSRWWEAFGEGQKLHVVVAEDGLRMVGILPLAIRPGGRSPFKWQQLEPMGSRDGADHLDMLVRRGYESSMPRALLEHLLAKRDGWDVLELSALDAQGLLVEAAKAVSQDWEEEEGDPCPYADLPDNWESYWQNQISSHQRKKQRRFARNLEAAHPGQVRYWMAKEESERERALNRLFELHCQKWAALGRPSIFENPALTGFHHQVSRALLEKGLLRLVVLSVGELDIAIEYGFIYGDTHFAFQAAYDAAWEEYSPGHLITQHALENCIAEGIRVYDFMRGDEDYKFRWASGTRHDRVLRLAASEKGKRMRQALEASRGVWSVVKPLLPEELKKRWR